MKIAIFSDIYGNDIAYEAAINDAKRRGATEFVVTGELVSDFHLLHKLLPEQRHS